jgi:hypothetical protein
MNHLAPLFATFDVAGRYQTSIQVHTPVPGEPTSKLGDWLPAGEVPSWRYRKPTRDLTELGRTMAADPAVASCQVARAWNWAWSKPDIVDDKAYVQASSIDALVARFASSGYRLKPVLKGIFTADAFVRF